MESQRFPSFVSASECFRHAMSLLFGLSNGIAASVQRRRSSCLPPLFSPVVSPSKLPPPSSTPPGSRVSLILLVDAQTRHARLCSCVALESHVPATLLPVRCKVTPRRQPFRPSGS